MTTATVVESKALVLASPVNVEQALKRADRREGLMALLGDAVPIERFEQIVIQSIYRNPDIQKASLASLLDAVRVSATLKLEPTGILGEGYLIKYGTDAQFEAGYRGLMKLARRSGQVASIDAQIVYVGDAFDIRLGTEPIIDHRPSLEGDRGKFKGAYAYARLTTGELIVEWMPDADIQAVRKTSRNGSGTNSPWVNHFGEMARKTVLKRLMKRLPLGSDAEMALRVEAEAEEVKPSAAGPSPNVTRIHERLGIAQPAEAPATEAAEAASDGAAPADLVSEAEKVFEGEFVESAPDPVPSDVQAGLDLLPPDHRKGGR